MFPQLKCKGIAYNTSNLLILGLHHIGGVAHFGHSPTFVTLMQGLKSSDKTNLTIVGMILKLHLLIQTVDYSHATHPPTPMHY